MKVKNAKLEWNVLLWDPNRKKVINYNIFNKEFIERIHKKIVQQKTITCYDELKENIKRWMCWRYWSRCEYEIHIGHFPSTTEELEKIDAYRQMEMNVDRITEYVINELKIKFDK